MHILNQDSTELHQFQIEVTFVWNCTARTSLRHSDSSRHYSQDAKITPFSHGRR